MDTQNHCCITMKNCVMDSRSNIIYVPHFREYVILTQELHIVTGIEYCPWCATRLPKDLRDEFFDIFYDELNLDLISNTEVLETPGLPAEFKTDEWWKKRNL